MVLYFYLQNIFIYFFMRMSKFAWIINWILDRLFFKYILPFFAHPNQALVKLNDQPHKSQLRNKMIKGKRDNMGKVENINVITKEEKTHEGKTFEK